MQTGDYVRITIDTYDGKESMYGRIDNISFAMGIYSEPIYEVATENDKSLFDAKELEYLRGPFAPGEVIQLWGGSVHVTYASPFSVGLMPLSVNVASTVEKVFHVLGELFGHSYSRSVTPQPRHNCTFVVWPMDYNKSACRGCGAWESK